jgi:hypothetical protein
MPQVVEAEPVQAKLLHRRAPHEPTKSVFPTFGRLLVLATVLVISTRASVC